MVMSQIIGLIGFLSLNSLSVRHLLRARWTCMWERKAHVVGVSDSALEGRGPREPQLALLSIPVWAPLAQLALQHPYPRRVLGFALLSYFTSSPKGARVCGWVFVSPFYSRDPGTQGQTLSVAVTWDLSHVQGGKAFTASWTRPEMLFCPLSIVCTCRHSTAGLRLTAVLGFLPRGCVASVSQGHSCQRTAQVAHG